MLIPQFTSTPSFRPSANAVVHRFGNGIADQHHGLGHPYYPCPEASAGMVSPSSRPIIVANDWKWITRDFYPAGYRLDDIQNQLGAGPSVVPAFKLPDRPATFGPPRTIVWPDPAIARPTATFRLSTGAVSRCQYDAYVEGFPHPYSRGSYHPTDKAKQQSKSKYYIVFYGHEVGIFKSWGGMLGTDL